MAEVGLYILHSIFTIVKVYSVKNVHSFKGLQREYTKRKEKKECCLENIIRINPNTLVSLLQGHSHQKLSLLSGHSDAVR